MYRLWSFTTRCDICSIAPHTRLTCHQRIYGGIRWDQFVRLATSITETLTDLMTDLVMANNNNNRLQQNRRTFTNYKKADGTQLQKTTIPTNIIFPNIILMADKHNIPKTTMHSNCRLLLEDIVCKITQRNNIRKANTCDPALKLLNEEITSDIHKHKQNIWKEHLDAH